MDVGRELREAREARGLSIKMLAATTRVHSRVLDAIERNDRAALPARPFARGFIASYAREVGLDPHPLVSRYFAQFDSTEETVKPAAAVATSTVSLDDATERPRWRPVVAIVAVTIVAVVLLRRVDEVRPPEPRPVGTSGTATAAAPAVPQPMVGRPAVPPLAPAPSGEIVVRLEASRPVWVSARADGTRVIYRIVQPGSPETVRARAEVALRVGDAGAVSMSVNGRDATVMGREGEVRNLRITNGSLIPYR
jgi:cytoskeleton protein RodZ